ncbi:MAG: benzoate-CoA ligase family protein [Gemmatimonadota bacterium]
MSVFTAHTDTFARDQLPPEKLWPALDFSALPELLQTSRLNAATELLDRTIQRTGGDRAALHFPGGRWTYQELQQKANQIAQVLIDSYGLVPGNRVLLRAPNNAMLVACWFAVLKAGGIGVCTMPLLRARELRYILDHAQVNIAVTDARFEKELDSAIEQTQREIPVVRFGNAELEVEMLQQPTEFEDVQTAPTDIAIVAYTSGTTGSAKGTVHFHRDLIAVCDTWSKHVLRPEPDDIFCGSPPLAFTYGLGGLVLFPMRVGASALVVEQTAPPQLLEAIARHRPSIIFTSPTGYRAMLTRLADFDLSSLRKCVSAGETLPLSTFEAWKAVTGIEIIDGIGATELLHIFISASGSDIKPGSTGKIVPGYRACVVDDDMREVPRGVIGKLAVQGPTGCRYLGNEERQRAYVRNGWNLTGDAYIQDEDGYFWYQARADDMIISSGYNISGPEVENVLLEHPCVLECGVVGVPDAERGHIVKAFIVLRPGHAAGDALVKELQMHVKSQIAPYKYPRAIEFVDALPRTNTGKLQRFRLRETETNA